MYFLYVKNIKMADEHFNSALPLVEAHHHYGQFLLALGQFEKALTHIKMYQSLNPKSYSNLSVSWVYAMSGQFTKAFSEINKVKEFQNESLYFHVGLQAIYEQTGKEEEAFLQLKKVMQLAGYNHKELDIVSAIFEQTQLKGVYSWLLKKDTKRLNIGQYTPPLALARYAIGAGEYDVAMEYLIQSFTQKQFEIMWAAVDPKYTPLSSNTEFQKLMKKTGVI
jgi:tetratricopeptide (TPR) repeat protein